MDGWTARLRCLKRFWISNGWYSRIWSARPSEISLFFPGIVIKSQHFVGSWCSNESEGNMVCFWRAFFGSFLALCWLLFLGFTIRFSLTLFFFFFPFLGLKKIMENIYVPLKFRQNLTVTFAICKKVGY